MSSTNPTGHGHDSHASGPPSAETIKRGYEEDVYDTKTVLSVPLLVILFFVLAFGTVTVLFSIYSKPTVDPNAHPQAKARNQADVNARLDRIGRGKEVDQPRLDQADRLDSRYDPRAITRPKLQDGNSRHLHPEDLILTKDGSPEVYVTDKGRVGLDKTMTLGNEVLKNLFKTQVTGSKPDDSQFVPTAANAGRGAEGSLVVVPKLPEAKQPEPKKTPEPAPMPKPKGGKQ